MIAMADVQQLTEDELRAKLYSSLQKKGILDSLKSQLRNSLARELRSSLSVEPHVPRPSLYHQISNYLITDYLQENGLEYTLSTYLPEAGVHLDKSPLLVSILVQNTQVIFHVKGIYSDNDISTILLSAEEVCNILGYYPQHTKVVSKKNKNASGLLLQLLQDLPALLNKPLPAVISCSVQTESEDQLTIRKKQEENEDSDDEQNIERRMLAFQRDCENRNKRMLELEMARFKEKEISLMRLDERNRYLKDLTEIKEQLKKQYQERLTSANKTIEEEKERLLRRESELEKGLFTQRQALLDEMEALKMREIELKRQSEIDKRSVALEKEKTMSLQELLTSKEELLDDLKQQYDQMAEAKLERYKAELETKKLTETQQIEQLKTQLEGSQESMRGLQTMFDKTVGDLQEERDRVKELHEQLHSSMNRQNELVKERENLQIKLETVVDYPILQGRVREMELQLETVRRQHEGERGQLKNKIAEQQVIIKELKNKVGKSSRQQVTTQQQLEEQLEDTKKKIMSLQHNNRLLKQENNKKMEMNKQLQHRLDQVMIELRSAHNEIQDLQEQIDDLHNILAAGGSVTEKTKIKKKHSPRRRPKPVSLSTPPSNNSPLPPLETLLLNPVVHSPSTPNNISFSDASAQLLAEARATFARMEREAEELTKTYNIFEPLSSTLLPSNDPIITETSRHLEEPMTPFTIATGVHPMLSYTDPILSVGHTHLSRSNVPPPVSNIPMPISTDTMATKQITSITSLSSNPTQTTSIVGSSSEKDPITTVITIVSTKDISLTTATSSITSSSSNPLSLDNLWKTAAVTSQSTITVTTIRTPLVTTLSPSVSSSNPLTLAAVTSQTTAIPIPTSLNTQQEDRSSVTITSSNVVEILSERVPDSSKPAGTSIMIPPKLDDLWKPSPHVVSSQVTSSIPPQSLSSTKLEAKMSDNNDEWERERERKLQLRQEQELKEQEKVQQELAKLQQEQSNEDKPLYNEDSNHDPSSPPGGGTVEDDNTNDHKETNWFIQQYLASIQCQSSPPPPGSLQYKDPSSPSDQTSNNLQVLSGPIDSLVSSGEGDSDPFENW